MTASIYPIIMASLITVTIVGFPAIVAWFALKELTNLRRG